MRAFSIFALAAGFGLVSASPTSSKHHHHNMNTTTNGTSIPPGNFSFEELWDLNNRFWTAFISPNNHKQAKMINSTLFSEDVKGKIDATRTFDGRELNTEYAFGMFSQIVLNPGSFNLLGAPVSYEVQQFAANVNIVATTLMIDFAVLSLGITYPIQVVGWFTYNAKGEVSQYDATFLRGLDWQFAQMTVDGMKKFNITDQAVFEKLVQQQLADSICTTEVNYCKGDLQQYQSKQDCMSFLTNGTVPLGGAWQLGMDTVGCRMVHMNMVPARPDVHCPHIGPTGGAYCNNDRQYAEYTTAKYFTNEAFTPFDLSAKVIGSLNGTVHNATKH